MDVVLLLGHCNRAEEADDRQHFERGIEVKVLEHQRLLPRGHNLQQQAQLPIDVQGACGA